MHSNLIGCQKNKRVSNNLLIIAVLKLVTLKK